MHENLLKYILCPNCGSNKLGLTKFYVQNNDIYEGIIECLSCSIWYKIEEGVLDLLPLNIRRNDLYEKFALKYCINFEITGLQKNTQKNQQIEFFKKDFINYENTVVNSKFYRALNVITFEKWLEENYGRIISPILEIGCGTGRQTLIIAKKKLWSSV
jgi:uncharacterized protein YbaR (Trm112 family)